MAAGVQRRGPRRYLVAERRRGQLCLVVLDRLRTPHCNRGDPELYVGEAYDVDGSYQAGSTPGYTYPSGTDIVTDTTLTSTASATASATGEHYGTQAVLFTAVAPEPSTSILWAGQYQDPTTGLYYMRARWYDPATGQFLSVDPDLAETGEPYAYAGDDPVKRGGPERA